MFTLRQRNSNYGRPAGIFGGFDRSFNRTFNNFLNREFLEDLEDDFGEEFYFYQPRRATQKRPEVLGIFPIRENKVSKQETSKRDLQEDDSGFNNVITHRMSKVIKNGKVIEDVEEHNEQSRSERPLKREGSDEFSIEVRDDHSEVVIGVSKDKYLPSSQLGYTRGSWALNLGKNELVHAGQTFSDYTQGVKSGDKVTCKVNRDQGTIEFLINGESLGLAFRDRQLKQASLFPIMHQRFNRS